MKLEEMIARIRDHGPKRIAVAAAEDSHVLEAVAEAAREGIARPVLCGDPEKIVKIAGECRIDLSPFEIIEAENSGKAASAAISLVREGRADILMKGLLQTADLMRAVLDKETGLRGTGILSHVGMIRPQGIGRVLYLTDGALIPYPDLDMKAQMIGNAVSVARSMGVKTPRVAALAAVETVNPKMQATVDAALLTAMNRRGQIRDCIVDGPLAMDLTISREAAKVKGVASEVAGNADILLFHNIEAANSVVKVFTAAMGCAMAGLVVGARAPIVVTSRSDSVKSKLLSIAAAICYVQWCKKQ